MHPKVRTVQTVCEAAGALAVAAAGFLIWVPLGLLLVGAMLIVAGNVKVSR